MSKLVDLFIEAGIDLNRVAAGTRRRIENEMQILRHEIGKLINNADIGLSTRTVGARRRLEAAIKKIDNAVDKAYDNMAGILRNELKELGIIEQLGLVNRVNDGIGREVFKEALSEAQIGKLVASKGFVRGYPLSGWIKKQAKDFKQQIAMEIRLGYAANAGISAIAAAARGTATGRRFKREGRQRIAYAGGVADGADNGISGLTATALNAIAAAVANAVYAANGDELIGVRTLVVLDNRTSVICRALSGGAWDNKGNPLPWSTVRTKFPGFPPYHVHCRTTLMPVFKGESKPNDPTYEAWLKTKPEAYQREVLGKSRYELWKAGKLTFVQMVDGRGAPLTVAQLKKKYGKE